MVCIWLDHGTTLSSAMSAAVYKALRSCCVKLEGTVITQSLMTLPPKFNVMSLACCNGVGRGESGKESVGERGDNISK